MYLTLICIYFIVLIGIGIWKSGKVRTHDDFSVAGRTLPAWILTGTMLATWIGTGSILGNAGKTYSIGIASVMLPIGSVLGIILLIKIAGKVRKMETTTVPEIIGNRFGGSACILSSITLTLAYLVIVSYQYNAGSSVLQVVLTDESGFPIISEHTGVLISAFFIISYTILAGLYSVAYTDVANSVIILFTFLIAFPLLVLKAGGMSGIESAFLETGRDAHLNFRGMFSTIDIINFCLPPFLLVLGDANMYQRFSAGKDVSNTYRSVKWFIFGVIIVELIIIMSAWVSSAMIPDAANGKHVLIYAAGNLLPPFLGAVMITTIVGIIVSTADSYLLVPATTLVKDIYIKYFKPTTTEKNAVLFSRIGVLILGIIAYFISRGFAESTGFFERALYAYTIYGVGITPVLMAALFWKRATPVGAILSIVSGVVVTLFWNEGAAYLPEYLTQMDEVIPGIFCSMVTLISVSMVTGEK